MAFALGTLIRVSEMILKLRNPVFVVYSLLGGILLLLVGPKKTFSMLERLRLAGRIGSVTLPDGPRIKLDFLSLIPLYEIYQLKCYERLVGFCPKPGDTVIDVGAHVGIYAAHCSRLVGPSGRVLAVEPQPLAFSLLKQNISRNGLTNVVPVRVALSDREGPAPLYYREGFIGGTLTKQSLAHLLVPTITLDKLRVEQKVATVDLLKVDAEGAELEVLSGANEAIAGRALRRLVIETHNNGYAKELGVRLANSGYEVEIVDVFPTIFAPKTFPTIFAWLA